MDRNPLHEKALKPDEIKVGDFLALVDSDSGYFRLTQVVSINDHGGYFVGESESLFSNEVFESRYYYLETGLKPHKNGKGVFWHKSNYVIYATDAYSLNIIRVNSRDYLRNVASKDVEMIREMRMSFSFNLSNYMTQQS